MKSSSVKKLEQNEESSRGHAIFILTVMKIDSKRSEATIGQLYLVDLAGSERVSKTTMNWEKSRPSDDELRIQEAKKINQSLFTLGVVINALATGKVLEGLIVLIVKKHVPYRSSMLTRLLKNRLDMNRGFKRLYKVLEAIQGLF